MFKKCLLRKSLEDQNESNAIDSAIQEKYDKYKLKDPFPEKIDSALLNPFDVKKYIEKTGMIHPFEERHLKTVTYGVPFKGEVHYWDDEKKITCDLDNVDFFEIKPNSIVYVHISTTFRVPYYMVFRFNLKIDLVHKGLLLGTGPVVDPGFQGRLLIPIHNLTSNTYRLKVGDTLIWVEFTKMSALPDNVEDSDLEKYEKLDLLHFSANDYFSKANSLNKVVSSIPEAMLEANRKSEEALRNTKRLQVGGALAALISSVAILYGGYQLITSIITPTIMLVSEYKDKQLSYEKSIFEMRSELEEIKEVLSSLEESHFDINLSTNDDDG